jgi:hypothetical protein
VAYRSGRRGSLLAVLIAPDLATPAGKIARVSDDAGTAPDPSRYITIRPRL